MDPLQEYSARRDLRQAKEAAFQKQFVQIGNWRFVIAAAAAVILWLAFYSHVVSGWLVLLPVVVFIALAAWHARVIRQRTLASRAVRYYTGGIDRLEDRWPGRGPSGDEFRNPDHVYAEDLDVFGKGSLFELISRARTGPGERTLASWLIAPSDRTEVLNRQEAVRELCNRLDLREEIALLGEDVRTEVHPDKIATWGSFKPMSESPLLRPLAAVLSIAAVTTFAAFFAHLLPVWPFVAILSCNFVFRFVVRKRVEHIMSAVETPARDLLILSLVLERIENETFTSARLRQISAALEAQRTRLRATSQGRNSLVHRVARLTPRPFCAGLSKLEGQPASKRIRKLERWIELLDSSDHLLVRVIRPVLLWNEQCALAVEAWRRENGSQIGHWLTAVGDFEALSSLAALAFEKPRWVTPVLIEERTTFEAPLFEAKALQHPLLPSANCVPNDVSIGKGLRLLIISGSNMSGKSTLLRSVGLNTVLAWAGAPVAASSLTISPLQVGASLRVSDSLQDNRSRFFAEISRLRQIVDLANGKRSVLYLLDELLSGTNSHDRKIGASAIVHTLFRAGAVGMITTHDLALAEIQTDIGSAAANAHFEDTITDGKVEFDFRLRPGIVTHSNALELMRAIGLNV